MWNLVKRPREVKDHISVWSPLSSEDDKSLIRVPAVFYNFSWPGNHAGSQREFDDGPHVSLCCW